MNKANGLVKDIAYGVIGGLIGTFALEQVASLFVPVRERRKKGRRKRALEKEDPAEAMARRLSEDVFGREISDEAKLKLGQAIH